MVYGYARVSTVKQAKEGNSLEAQEAVLRQNGAEEVFKDTFTGKVANRPQFEALMGKIKSGDTLLVTKLDRVARSASQGAALIDGLLDKGVTVYVLNMGKMDDTPMGKLARTMMLAFAEFERDMIVERTQEGRRIARQNPNYKDGRPKKFTRKQISHAMQLLADHSYTQVAELTGISKATLYREHKKLSDVVVEQEETQVPGQMDIEDFM